MTSLIFGIKKLRVVLYLTFVHDKLPSPPSRCVRPFRRVLLRPNLIKLIIKG